MAVELMTPSASLPLELHGLVGRAMAMATTALLVAHVDAIETCAWLTETVISCSGFGVMVTAVDGLLLLVVLVVVVMVVVAEAGSAVTVATQTSDSGRRK